MKKIIVTLIAGLFALQTAVAAAADEPLPLSLEKADSAQKARPFCVHLVNKEYKIYMKINLYDKNLKVPGQDVYGELDGYIGSLQGSGMWLITSSEVKNARSATIEVINDYGSEDFTATLKVNSDGSYTLKKDGGSTLKFAVRGKWQKLPNTIQMIKN